MTRTGIRQNGGGNRLYFGDNLTVLREHVKDESVDLIYLDPPFNSDVNYNVVPVAIRTRIGRPSGSLSRLLGMGG
jgi:16S rRNA G966 N2-methylase RsmD